jgi:hypothetical protein
VHLLNLSHGSVTVSAIVLLAAYLTGMATGAWVRGGSKGKDEVIPDE